MWYEIVKNNLYKQSASMGMYIESLSKNISRLIVNNLREKIKIRGDSTFSGTLVECKIDDAIDMMQVPASTKDLFEGIFQQVTKHQLAIGNNTRHRIFCAKKGYYES
jgi:hypothetical protein